ncbi:uncharacterized protein LOC142583738 [Dermacentor variabilis]|uniref:uncharacterized protein LOC142583738 n=1 Tax=Dermacentor variabilis TaxID=34621 RepID=UPI003F5C92B0
MQPPPNMAQRKEEPGANSDTTSRHLFFWSPFDDCTHIQAKTKPTAAGHGPGETRSLQMENAHGAHSFQDRYTPEPVLLELHSNSPFYRHTSSTTPSASSGFNLMLVAHQALCAIKRGDTVLWAMGHGSWPQGQMDNLFVFIVQGP